MTHVPRLLRPRIHTAATVLATLLLLAACDAPPPTEISSGEMAAASAQNGFATAAFTYEITISGADFRVAATADAVLGPPGTGLLTAAGTPFEGVQDSWNAGRPRTDVFRLLRVRASATEVRRWLSSGARATVSFTVRNRAGQLVEILALLNVRPTKVTGPEFNSDANEVVIEELELTADGLGLPCHNTDIGCQ
ncbi:phage tail protein [Gemmatimonas sp.]|uniref:phage tail protein n=1 Tax=Gemmatimonas sp. TaxID=1962908 RepID=UPI0039833006